MGEWGECSGDCRGEFDGNIMGGEDNVVYVLIERGLIVVYGGKFGGGEVRGRVEEMGEG